MDINVFVYLLVLLIYFITHFRKSVKDNNERVIENRDNLFLKLSFIFLFIVLIIREPYSDMISYIKYFHYSNNLLFNEVMFSTRLEPLYSLYSYIIGKIWFNDRFFIVMIDILTCIGPYYAIKNYSKNYLLSVLLFLSIGTYCMQFYVIRQSIAITFLLFSLKYIKENKLFKFVSLVIIASLFHKTSILFLMVYPLSKFDKKILIFSFGIASCFVFIFRKSMYALLNYTVYSNYLGSSYDVDGTGYGKLALFVLLLLFVFLFYKRNNAIVESNNKLMLTLSIICILFQIFSTQISLITRLANDFSISFVILPANVISALSKKNKKIMTLLTLIIIFIYLLFIHPIKGYSIFVN